MEKNLNFINKLHSSTKRNYLKRMKKSKPLNVKIAKKFAKDFWDGKRQFGYGGYRYIKDHFKPLAIKLIKRYRLNSNSKILDVGCGKGFLLFEIQKLIPGIKIFGFDISKYAIKNSKSEVKDKIFVYNAKNKYPFKRKFFDLVFSINTLHNLRIYDLKKSLKEIERVAKKKYIVVESYRNEKEFFNLQCWSLTAVAFFNTEEWRWIFKQFKYRGDYEFIFFK
tara:strand:+ start:19 stop:684 length:666 start_codon:yes stop_codon:yes gene_type:complete